MAAISRGETSQERDAYRMAHAADPVGANLHGADQHAADLHVADPRGALRHRLPHVVTLPDAVGCGIIVYLSQAPADGLRSALADLDRDFEQAFSRFRPDSILSEAARPFSPGEGPRRLRFPFDADAMFSICDALAARTNGAFDPCVGESLVRLGYGHAIETGDGTAGADVGPRSCPRWGADVIHEGDELIVRRPVNLDFGAVGKGFLVDLLAARIRRLMPTCEMTINAGGDLFTTVALTIALEDPADPTRAVGVARIKGGAFCASSPSRRRWTAADGLTPVHHLLDAITGRPVRDVVASWTYVAPGQTMYPTAWADAQSTAAFTGLASGFPFARLRADRRVETTPTFPARFFTS